MSIDIAVALCLFGVVMFEKIVLATRVEVLQSIFLVLKAIDNVLHNTHIMPAYCSLSGSWVVLTCRFVK